MYMFALIFAGGVVMAVFARSADIGDLGQNFIYLGLAGMTITGLLSVIARLIRADHKRRGKIPLSRMR